MTCGVPQKDKDSLLLTFKATIFYTSMKTGFLNWFCMHKS